MLHTDEALDKLRVVLNKYTLSYSILNVTSDNFNIQLAHDIVVYFSESNQTWGIIDGDKGFMYLTLESLTNAIYRVLWLDIFRSRQLILHALLCDVTGHTLVLADTSEDERVYTYTSDDLGGITITVFAETADSPYLLRIDDFDTEDGVDTYFLFKENGVPVVYLDADIYYSLVSIFYQTQVQVSLTATKDIIFKFEDLSVSCKIDFDSKVFTVTGIDGVECMSEIKVNNLFDFDTLYIECKKLSEVINPVTDEFRGIVDDIVYDANCMLHLSLSVDKYNPGGITYLKSGTNIDYSFSVYKYEQSSDVYVLAVLDDCFGEVAVTVQYRIVDGKPVRLLDYDSYTGIVSTVFGEIVELSDIRQDSGVFRFEFADDYADLIDLVAQVDYKTGIYTVLSVGGTPTGKEIFSSSRGIFDFENLYKFCVDLAKPSSNPYVSQGFKDFKKDTLPTSSAFLQIVMHNNEPIAVHLVGDDYIQSITVEKASKLGLPVSRIADKVEAVNHRGMLLSPTEIERKIFAEDITNNEDLCRRVIDVFWS